jgi:hypothetical protein
MPGIYVVDVIYCYRTDIMQEQSEVLRFMVISGVGNSVMNAPQQYAVKRGGDTVAASDQMRAKPAGNEAQTTQDAQQVREQQRIQQQVQQLKAQEEQVKTHEAAHKAAGGQFASSATYSYRPGPDGRSYIVGGEVQIDMSPGRTPQETIAKMQIVQRAAMAPGDPSGQDRAVAAQAAAQAAQAQQDQLQQANAEQAQAPSASSNPAPPTGNTPPTMANGINSQAKAPVAIDQASSPAVPAVIAKQEDVVATVKTDQDVETRQITAYKANTTPGDIFAAQKMSTYA